MERWAAAATRRAILAAAPERALIGIDRDPAALAAAARGWRRSAIARSWSTASIGDMRAHPRRRSASPRSTASCSISACRRRSSTTPSAASRSRKEGPLDMRMDPTRGPDRARADPANSMRDELADVLCDARRGAPRPEDRAARSRKRLARTSSHTTTELAALIVARRSRCASSASRRSTPRRARSRRCASRSTRELDAARALPRRVPGSAGAGRPLRRSSASTRSRIGLVKKRFRDLAWTELAAAAARRARPASASPPVCELLTRKAVVAGDAEIARNPRARSAPRCARLRAHDRSQPPSTCRRGTMLDATMTIAEKIVRPDRAWVTRRRCRRTVYRIFQRGDGEARRCAPW